MKRLKLTVVSLFDGIGGALNALEKAKLPIGTYIYSEINTHAESVFLYNVKHDPRFGGTTFINVGDIRSVVYKSRRFHSPSLVRQGYKKGLLIPCVHLLVGGFPCPSFSLSGAQKGFDDDRGQLFFEYLRLLESIKPMYFLAENVKMKPKHAEFISEQLKVPYIAIDAGKYTEQKRLRYYWTNIPEAEKFLEACKRDASQNTLRNVLIPTSKVPAKALLSQKIQDRLQLLRPNRPSNGPRGTTLGGNCSRHGQRDVVYGDKQQIGCLTATDYKQPKQILLRIDEHLDKLMKERGIKPSANHSYVIRKLLPIEAERLQGFPDNYTAFGQHPETNKIYKISDTQRYMMLGNSFSVYVVFLILRNLPNALKDQSGIARLLKQLTDSIRK